MITTDTCIGGIFNIDALASEPPVLTEMRKGFMHFSVPFLFCDPIHVTYS